MNLISGGEKAWRVAGRVGRPQIAEEVLVEGERQVGVHPALHQDASAVEGQRLLDLAADLLERQQIPLGVAGLPVEGAEAALVDADVGVVDVAVDVVGGDRGVVEAVAHLVGGHSELQQVAVEQQRMGIAGRDAAAGQGVVENLLDRASGGFEVHSRLTLPYPVPRMMKELEGLRIVVVSDDPLARTGIALLLGGSEGLTVLDPVGVDDDWSEPGEEGDEEEPDAAVWDLGLGARSGLERLRALGPAAPPVVAIVADAVDAREALAAGARAALPRNVDGERLAAAVRAAVQGLVVLDDSFAAALLRDAPTPPADLPESLTPREAEVLQLLSQGLANKSIAQRLGISDHTVKFHVNAILGKLGVQSRGEAIVQAVRLGLVAL